MCAPTGAGTWLATADDPLCCSCNLSFFLVAGKTNVAMLTVTAHFRDVGLLGHDEGRSLDTGKKAVYIAPMVRVSAGPTVYDGSHTKARLYLPFFVTLESPCSRSC